MNEIIVNKYRSQAVPVALVLREIKLERFYIVVATLSPPKITNEKFQSAETIVWCPIK